MFCEIIKIITASYFLLLSKDFIQINGTIKVVIALFKKVLESERSTQNRSPKVFIISLRPQRVFCVR